MIADTSVELIENAIGTILIIASLAVMAVSAYTVYMIQDVGGDLEEIENAYGEIASVTQTEEFNQTLETLDSMQSSNIRIDRVRRAVPVFREIQKHGRAGNAALEQLADIQDTHQWLFFGGLLGVVAGVLLRYL